MQPLHHLFTSCHCPSNGENSETRLEELITSSNVFLHSSWDEEAVKGWPLPDLNVKLCSHATFFSL